MLQLRHIVHKVVSLTPIMFQVLASLTVYCCYIYRYKVVTLT